MRKELCRIDNLTLSLEESREVRDIHLFLREGEWYCLEGEEHSGRHELARFFKEGGIVKKGCIVFQKRQLETYTRNSFEKNHIFYVNGSVPFFNSLDIGENFYLLRRSSFWKLLINKNALHIQTGAVLVHYGLNYEARGETKVLTKLDKILIGIVKAVDQGAKLIVLDQISNGLSEEEINRIVKLLNRLKLENISLLINDNWPEYYYGAADCRVLFHDGEIIRKEAVKLPVGCKNSEGKPVSKAACGTQKTVHGKEIYRFTSGEFELTAARGEIICIHAERTVRLEAIWKALRLEGEKAKVRLELEGKSFSCHNIQKLLRARVVFCAAVDSANQIVSQMSVWDNVFLPSFRRISKFSFYRKNMEFIKQDFCFPKDRLEQIDTEHLSWNDRNQILLNRWKLYRPKVIFLYGFYSSSDEQGRRELIDGIMELSERGSAVVMLEAAELDGIVGARVISI